MFTYFILAIMASGQYLPPFTSLKISYGRCLLSPCKTSISLLLYGRASYWCALYNNHLKLIHDTLSRTSGGHRNRDHWLTFYSDAIFLVLQVAKHPQRLNAECLWKSFLLLVDVGSGYCLYLDVHVEIRGGKKSNGIKSCPHGKRQNKYMLQY